MDLVFQLDKATKNTIRYEEKPADGQAPIVGTLYVQKWWVGAAPPQELKVTVEK